MRCTSVTPGRSLVQCIFGFFMNIPIYVLCMIIAWSYYTVVFISCAGKVPQYVPNDLYIIPYHLALILFSWSFWRSVKTLIPPVPKQFCLSPSETVRFIELDSEHERNAYLEHLVKEKSLPITLNNKRGTVPFCDICFLIKPDRTHHCSSCEKCVPKMDHHCPWINNCVGYHNQKYFLLFLFHAICYCFLCFLSTLGFFIHFVHNQTDFDLNGMHVFFLFVISLVFAIALFALLLFQLALLFGNSSTLEHFRSPNFRDSTVHTTFNLGFKANFVQVFGLRPLLWLIPIPTSQGDGFSFPVRTAGGDGSRAPLLYSV